MSGDAIDADEAQAWQHERYLNTSEIYGSAHGETKRSESLNET